MNKVINACWMYTTVRAVDMAIPVHDARNAFLVGVAMLVVAHVVEIAHDKWVAK